VLDAWHHLLRGLLTGADAVLVPIQDRDVVESNSRLLRRCADAVP
jgi:hypothetical protein